jgi:chromosome segregation ATPase
MTLSHPLRSALAGAALILVAGAPLQSLAAEPQSGAGELDPTQEQVQAYKAAQQELTQLQERVSAIRDTAMEENPELRKQGEDLKDLVASKIDARGYDLEGAAEKLQSIQKQLQNEDLPQDQQEQLVGEFKDMQRELLQVRNDVMQDEEVQNAQAQLQEELLAAMREEEPELNQILSQMEQAREEMMRIVRAARR